MKGGSRPTCSATLPAQASGYGMNTATDFFSVLQLLALAGDAQPPAAYRSAVEQMFDFYVYTSDQQGCLPRNGDSAVCGSGFSAAAAAYFNRSDWLFVHTAGANGSAPAQASPSNAFPWAGQVVFRSGFGSGSTWAWFDAGPYGSSGHGHRDKLALNVHARGAMLLVDSGRFAYSGNDTSARLHIAYARNATAHNTLTLDGCDQLPEPAVASAPLPADAVVFTPDADAAFASMDVFDGDCLVGAATHSRGVYFARAAAAAAGGDSADGDFIVVVDVVLSPARPRSVQAHWHSHPNASAFALNASSGAALVGGARWSGEPLPAQACLLPATGASAGWQRVSVHAGDLPPAAYQGWYSHAYDDATPARTLVYEGSTGALGDTGVWAWLIVPSGAPRDCALDGARVLAANGSHVRVAVDVGGQPEREVAVRYR